MQPGYIPKIIPISLCLTLKFLLRPVLYQFGKNKKDRADCARPNKMAAESGGEKYIFENGSKRWAENGSDSWHSSEYLMRS